MEHSYINDSFVTALENLISPDGMFHKSRVVWAGDYADKEPDSEHNLYFMAQADESKKLDPVGPPHDFFRCIIGRTYWVVKQNADIYAYCKERWRWFG